MLYFNVLSLDDYLPIQHGRYTNEIDAQRHVERLKAQGINAYYVAWRKFA